MNRDSATTATFQALESYGAAFRTLPRALVTAGYNFGADGLFNQCAAISYYALLSVAPFVSLLASILGSFLGGNQEGTEAPIERIATLIPELPPEILEVAASFLQYRGAIGAAALVATLWVSHLVFAALQTAVSQIFRRPTAVEMDWRHFALQTAWAWAKPFLLFFAAATMLLLSFAFASIETVLHGIDAPFAQRILEFTDNSTVLNMAGSLVAGIIVFALVQQALAPHLLSLRVLLPSAIVGYVLWEIASQLFGSYLRYAVSVRSFTGPAGAIVIFMLWIYYAAAVLLFSMQVAAVLSGARGADGTTARDAAHTL